MVLDRTAKLDGFEGRLVSGGAQFGEWSADMEVDLLVRLLQAAASGREVSLDVSGGVRKVVLRTCWYDVPKGVVRVTFETSGIAA